MKNKKRKKETCDLNLSFRVSAKVKKQLEKNAKVSGLNMSQFLIMRIEQKYKYIKELKNFYEAYETIYNISDILSYIILDKSNKPRDEFNNSIILIPFYNVKYVADNTDFNTPDSETMLDSSSKTERISLRLHSGTNKKLNFIAEFYEYKKSSIIPFLLSDDKHADIDSALPECFCYLTDIKNYFYENQIINQDFEREYGLLWEKLL